MSDFLHFWHLTVLKKYSLSPLRDENFFSSSMANEVSKNPYFLTEFKNVKFILAKSAPQKGLARKLSQNLFWMYFLLRSNVHEISIKARIFWYPIRPIQRTKVIIS